MDICCWLDLPSRQNQNVEVFQPVTCSFHPKTMMKSPKYWLGMWEMRFELESVPTRREQLQQEKAAKSLVVTAFAGGVGEEKNQDSIQSLPR